MDQHSGIAEVREFRWDSQNAASLLPPAWDLELIDVAKNFKTGRALLPPHSTSREHPSVTSLVVHGVGGRVVQERLPWLVDLYRTKFREVGEQFRGEPLTTAVDPRYAVVLNVEVRGERYECHVDTNPVEGLLYVTDHPRGTGGELAVAKDINARSKEEIDANCVELYPKKGELVFFDGRFHPHYMRPLKVGEIRVAVAMNYYTQATPESTRPPDLNEYLYGSQA
jgi:hypothetical protein